MNILSKIKKSFNRPDEFNFEPSPDATKAIEDARKFVQVKVEKGAKEK